MLLRTRRRSSVQRIPGAHSVRIRRLLAAHDNLLDVGGLPIGAWIIRRLTTLRAAPSRAASSSRSRSCARRASRPPGPSQSAPLLASRAYVAQGGRARSVAGSERFRPSRWAQDVAQPVGSTQHGRERRPQALALGARRGAGAPHDPPRAGLRGCERAVRTFEWLLGRLEHAGAKARVLLDLVDERCPPALVDVARGPLEEGRRKHSSVRRRR